MKIDCEWAEYDIILNMNHQVLSKIVKIAMEIETFWDKKPETIIQFLEANGFKCAQMWGSLFAINTKYL